MRLGAFPVICAQDLVFGLSALRQHLPWGVTVHVPHWRAVKKKKKRRRREKRKNPLYNFNAFRAGRCGLNPDLKRAEEQHLVIHPASCWSWGLTQNFLSIIIHYYFTLFFSPKAIGSAVGANQSFLLVHCKRWRHKLTRSLNRESDFDPLLCVPRLCTHPQIWDGLKVLAAASVGSVYLAVKLDRKLRWPSSSRSENSWSHDHCAI